MRQEDKEVDGFELEREEQRKRESELIEEDEEELEDLSAHSALTRGQEHTDLVTAAMHKILEREPLVLDALGLPGRELRALEALKTAVDGRDPGLHGFVFAEDRRILLEQALAVLQPAIANLETIGGAAYETLVLDVAELREHLDHLEDAQEEIEPHKRKPAKAADADDKDDDDKPDDDTSLTGPERTIVKPASSLAGPERKAEPKPPTTLTGPDRKAEPKPPTTLGDPNEIAAAAAPWWKQK